jgi:hypothetical protein
MIPEYKLYQGAALAELVDLAPGAITIREVVDAGRMSSYVLNERVGLHIKHSAQRLHPWSFTFTNQQIASIRAMLFEHPVSFLVLVCWTDGLLAIPLDHALSAIEWGAEDSWLRVDRRKRQMYRVFGPTGEFSSKYRTDLADVVRAAAD